MEKLAVTISEARKLTGIGRNSLFKLVQTGEIRAKRIGKKWLIPVAELERWLIDLEK